MTMQKLFAPLLELKAKDDGLTQGQFKGYGAVFNNIDYGNDKILPTAFDDDLKNWKSSNQLPLMAFYHDMRVVVGDWLEMDVDAKGLKVKGELWTGEKQTNESKMAYNMMLGTGPKALSIGFIPEKLGYEKDKQNNQIRLIEKAKLYEVSIVPFGMNPKALITSAKSLLNADGGIVSKRELEQFLREAGLSSTQAKALISKGYNAIVDDSSQELEDLAKIIQKTIDTMKGVK